MTKHPLIHTLNSSLYPTLIEIESKSTCYHALALMQQFNILALPVFTFKGAPFKKEYLGIVSIQDVMSHLVLQKGIEAFELGSKDESTSFENYLRSLEFLDQVKATW